MRGRQPKKSRPSSAELRLIEQVMARTPRPATPSQAESAVTSVAGKTGDVALAKADVGLANVENTSDASKPVSTATQTALNAKASSSHNHDASYAAIAHNHDASYSALGHDHSGTYEPANANIQAHVAAAHAPANAQKNSDITKAEIEDKLTGEITSHTHPGGAGSAWVTIKKTSDEPRTASPNLTADGTLQLTLAAATRYRIFISVFLTTASATPDYKYDLSFSGTVGEALCRRRHSAAGAVAGTDSENTLAQSGLLASTAVAATTTGVGFVEIDVEILTVLGGTFAFRWAQNTSDVAAVTVKAGSYLEYMTV